METKENQKICLKTADIHNKYLPEIINSFNEAKKGIPIIRSVAFNENDSKYSLINDQFFLGDDLLVCPQVKKEKTRKKFHIKRDNKYNSCKKIPILGKNIKNIKNPKEKISKNIQND